MAGGSFRSSDQCQQVDLTASKVPVVDHLSFHRLIIWIGTICAALAIIISIGHIFFHAFNCYRVAEQKYLMRVITVVPAFVIIHTLGVWFYPTFQYLQLIPEIVEAIALVSLFQLFTLQATDTLHRYDQDAWFANLERQKPKRMIDIFIPKATPVVPHHNGSLRWYRVICCCIYQFPVTKLCWTVLDIILTAIFCPTAKAGKLVKVLNAIVNFSTTSFALYALIIFYWRLRPVLKPRHAFRKALVLKKMIGIVLAQAAILSLVEGAGGIHPTPTMSFGDFTVGLPGFMSQCEFFLFAIGFLFCYNVSEYKELGRRDQEGGMGQQSGLMGPSGGSNSNGTATGKVGFMHAIIAMLNISDLLVAIGRSGKHLFELRRKVYTVNGQTVPIKSLSPVSSNDPYTAPSSYPNGHPAANQHQYDDSAPNPYDDARMNTAYAPHDQHAYTPALAPGSVPIAYDAPAAAPQHPGQQPPATHSYYQPYNPQPHQSQYEYGGPRDI